MRWITVILLLSICAIDYAQVHLRRRAQAEPPAPDSVVLATVWYRGENNANDSGENGYNGTYAGGYDDALVKEGSYAFEFEATDILTFYNFTINADTNAFSCWYYHESTETDNSAGIILRSGNTTNGWTLEHDQVNGDLEFHKFVGGTDYEARTGNGALSDNTWYHIIIQTYGNSGGYCEMYINGSDADIDNVTNASGTFATGQITMGSNLNSTVDNIAFFSGRLLTSDQRTYLYQHPETTLKEAK